MSEPEVNHSLQNYDDTKSYISKNKEKIIIFLATSFFSIHTLVYILKFKLNFPFGDDSQASSFVYEYLATGSLDGLFGITAISDYASHLIYSMKLLILPNLIYNSFDVVNFYYLQWVIMSLTLLLLFLILKKTDKRLYWVLIPISAFIYCPIYNTGYFIFSSVMWLMVTLCIVLIVFLLNREKITNSIFLSSISVAIFSTFLNLIGTVAWIAGFLCLLKRDGERKSIKKKYLIAWIISTAISGYVFVSLATSLGVIQFDEELHLKQFFSIEGISFVITYLATSYRFGTENIVFSKIIGIITLMLSGYFFYYFLRIKNNIQGSHPWLVFILLSIISGIIIGIGRIEGHDGNESFYKAVSQFSQIGILVLVSMIILEIKKNRARKFANLKLCFCILIIVSQMVFLVPSYYASWIKGEYYYDVKNAYVDCYSLTHGTECWEWPDHLSGYTPPFESSKMYVTNFWLENKMSIFGEADFNQQNRYDLNEFRNMLESNSDIEFGFGKIEKINGELISEESVVVKESFVNIEGWMLDDNKMSVNSIFLMIDGEPLLKYDDFVYRDDISKSNSGWNIIFLSGYIEKGCHEVAVIGLSGESLLKIEQEIEMCRI